MANTRFPDGIRLWRPREGAPQWLMHDITINTQEFIDWLQNEGKDTVRLQIAVSKEKGNPYLRVDDFVPDKTKARQSGEDMGDVSRPIDTRYFDDSVPF